MDKTRQRNKLITYTGIVTALFAVLGPISIKVNPSVPMTLQPLMLSMITLLLPFKAAMISIVIYLMLGALGLPVFSDYAGGAWHFVGPTGGFLFGFALFPIAYNLFTKTNLIKHKWFNAFVGLALSHAILYTFGILGLSILTESKWTEANLFIKNFLLPFYTINIAQSVIAVVIYKGIDKAGLNIK